MQFICKDPTSTTDEILTYNEILDNLEKEKNEMDDNTEHLWRYCHIEAHQVHSVLHIRTGKGQHKTSG
jgi:hypothetical protein